MKINNLSDLSVSKVVQPKIVDKGLDKLLDNSGQLWTSL